MKTCFNHPTKKAFSICHGCGKDYCELCLDEGTEYYYCKNPECQKLLLEELPTDLVHEKIICPNCSCEFKLTDKERTSKKVQCQVCDAYIDLNVNPPKVFHKKNYIELFSSLNQGDIALIKSILDDAEVDYYVFGENFLGVRPLLEPARFFVNEDQLEQAKEVLKDFQLNMWGTSKNQYE